MRVGTATDGTWRDAGARVAILCPKVWGIRNMVHAGVVADLTARGIDVVLLVPHPEDLQDELGGAAGTVVERLAPPVTGPRRGTALASAVLHASFARRHGLAFPSLLRRWRRRNSGVSLVIRDAAVELLSFLGSRRPLYGWQVRQVDRRFARSRDLEPVRTQLEQLRPTLLVSTNCQFSDERPYVIAARELGIPTLACIQSFDNLTTRSVLPVFDHYALWNDRMRNQLLRFYPDRNPATVHVTGTPQFDFHVRPEFCWDRATTLAHLGLAATARYLLHGPTRFPTEPELLRALARGCAATPELARHRIVVRPHPSEKRTRWEQLVVEEPRIVLSWPWGVPPGRAWDAPGGARPVDQARLVSVLLHADVCVNTASTISLDAAAVGTPVVCAAFAGKPGGLEDRVCREGHESAHFRPIIESGGVRLARNVRELLGEAAAYVRNRERDAEGRRRLVAEECGTVDGRAARRIAELIGRLVQDQRGEKHGGGRGTPVGLQLEVRHV